MIYRDQKTGEYGGIRCDEPGCEVKAPPSKEILAAHGLNRMGWRCSGGTHFCPEHADARTV